MPRGVKLTVTAEEMLEMRNKRKMSNKQIAEEVGCHSNIVLRYIGKQPEWMTHANQVKSGQRVGALRKTKEPEKTPEKAGRVGRPSVAMSNEEMLRLRADGLSDTAIAEIAGCAVSTIAKRIGPRPKDVVTAERLERLKKAKEAKKAKEPEKPIIKIAPVMMSPTPAPAPTPVVEPALTPVTVPTPKPAPTPKPVNSNAQSPTIPLSLFSFADTPYWLDHLSGLAKMAQPEPWKFLNPEVELRNEETPILERYIHQTFSRLAARYNNLSKEESLKAVYIAGGLSCFNTGLLTPLFKHIYAIFKLNNNPNVAQKWYFVGFVDDASPYLRNVHPLPLPPSQTFTQDEIFHPERPIRVNTSHILDTQDNRQRLPEEIRDAWNLPLLLEAAVEMARRRVLVEPHHVVVDPNPSRPRFLVPVYLTNMEKPDLVMCLESVGEYYMCRTLLTLQMAYLYARSQGRPSVKWLADLVE